MFNVIYRWRIHPGKEAQFQKAWAEVTELIRTDRGGLGSRLHRCDDGTFLAYAQWPSREAWEKSSRTPLPESRAVTSLKEAVASSEPPIPMMMIEDLI